MFLRIWINDDIYIYIYIFFFFGGGGELWRFFKTILKRILMRILNKMNDEVDLRPDPPSWRDLYTDDSWKMMTMIMIMTVTLKMIIMILIIIKMMRNLILNNYIQETCFYFLHCMFHCFFLALFTVFAALITDTFYKFAFFVWLSGK